MIDLYAVALTSILVIMVGAALIIRQANRRPSLERQAMELRRLTRCIWELVEDKQDVDPLAAVIADMISRTELPEKLHWK